MLLKSRFAGLPTSVGMSSENMPTEVGKPAMDCW
jgi:hypothetical protein